VPRQTDPEKIISKRFLILSGRVRQHATRPQQTFILAEVTTTHRHVAEAPSFLARNLCNYISDLNVDYGFANASWLLLLLEPQDTLINTLITH
jgi:hypothetical protein